MDSDGYSSFEEVKPKPSKLKGKGKAKLEERKRSSKACDPCRRAKCKCERTTTPGPCINCVVLGTPCTYLQITRKRGPAKGYIEVLETRCRTMEATISRMENLMGTLLTNEDPRCSALLAELFGAEAVRELANQTAASANLSQTAQRKKEMPPSSNPPTSIPDASTVPHAQASTSGSQQPPTNELGFGNESAPTADFSPRQRRKLSISASPATTSHSLDARKMAYQFSSQTKTSTGVIGHTQDGLTELQDVIGQLSLTEDAEVRYHGRSSGLYLISRSAKYQDFYWDLPPPGPSHHAVIKSEAEIMAIVGVHNPLPDMATQHHLLDLYWAYVHPHYPILFKPRFQRQYQAGLLNPRSDSQLPTILLLAMFALASRYSDSDVARADGHTRGQGYLEAAVKIFNYSHGSRIVNVQVLLLLSYREIGTGSSSAWLFAGMATRIAQDLGLFRDLPVQRFSHEDKQTRKRVWYGCILLDRYVSCFIGRPMAIFERDYDVGFPSETEPEELEAWQPIRTDGLQWGSPMMPGGNTIGTVPFVSTKAHCISSFNASAALSVLIGRVISSVYAIGVRVLGQSSEALLSLLDQSLASWYLALPVHLAYSPGTKIVPLPHVLSLHLQFYSALLLLHRPFIPGSNSEISDQSFPSHSICTTSSNAIASIISDYSRTYSLRQVQPFVIYPVFSAAIIAYYNISFDESLAATAKATLRICMDALLNISRTWGSARRQWELLHGLVDLRESDPAPPVGASALLARRGSMKRAVETEPALQVRQGLNFQPVRHPRSSSIEPTRRRRASSNVRSKLDGSALPSPPIHSSPLNSPAMHAPALPSPRVIVESPFAPDRPQGPNLTTAPAPNTAYFHAIPTQTAFNPYPSEVHQTYEILDDATDLSQFQSSHTADYSDLLNSFLSPTEAAHLASTTAQADTVPFSHTYAFGGVPFGAASDIGGDEWKTLMSRYIAPDP